jgi:hypothetical protein
MDTAPSPKRSKENLAAFGRFLRNQAVGMRAALGLRGHRFGGFVGFFTLEVSVAALAFFDFIILLSHNNLYNATDIGLLIGTTMTIRPSAINLYLLLSFFLFLASCKTTEDGTKKKDKEATVIRFHLEVNSDGTDKNSGVPIYREHPVLVNVHQIPFLDEGSVKEASVVETIGGYAIRIQFDRHGTIVLDNTTTAYKGQRVAIYVRYTEARWLAAPLISRRIQNGEFIFTPDATREEAERIVKGLNNVAKKLQE